MNHLEKPKLGRLFELRCEGSVPAVPGQEAPSPARRCEAVDAVDVVLARPAVVGVLDAIVFDRSALHALGPAQLHDVAARRAPLCAAMAAVEPPPLPQE